MFDKDWKDKQRQTLKKEVKTLRSTQGQLNSIQDEKDEIIQMQEAEIEQLKQEKMILEKSNEELRDGIEMAKSSSGSTLKQLGLIT